MSALLKAHDLAKTFVARAGWFGASQKHHAVNGVSFSIDQGETLALVGESGSGKSTVARGILRLLELDRGTVFFDGVSVLTADRPGLKALRRKMQIVFQDPYGSLDPRMTAGQSVAEGIEIHQLLPKSEIRARVGQLLEEVGLSSDAADKYPHQFSGGQRQRIGIARALAVGPSFLVLDEPVSALDVSVQAQIINLLLDLQRDHRLAYLFIAHDLAVVRQIAGRIAVMYFGMIVELGARDQILTRPRHPYTVALLSAVPDPDPSVKVERITLAGDPPAADRLPAGCPFVERCFHPAKNERCVIERPELRPLHGGQVACHYAEIPITLSE